MKDIKELALKVAKEMNWRMDEMTLETFATRLIAAYCEGQDYRSIADAVVGNLEGRKQVINLDFDEELVQEIMQELADTIRDGFTAPPELAFPTCKPPLQVEKFSSDAAEKALVTPEDLLPAAGGSPAVFCPDTPLRKLFEDWVKRRAPIAEFTRNKNGEYIVLGMHGEYLAFCAGASIDFPGAAPSSEEVRDAAYTEGQEPVAWRTHHDEPMLFPTINEAWQYCEDDEGPEPLFTAPPEPAQNLYREIYEVWAGSEGIPMPRTAPEAYLLGLLEQMVDIAKTGMHMTEPAPQTDGSTTVSAPDQERMSRSVCAAPSSEEVGQLHPDMARSAAKSALGYAGSFNDKGIDWHNDKPWPHRMELAQALDWITELGAMVLNLADRVTPAAPSSEEVREMVGRLYGDLDGGPSSWLKQEAAAFIERLAARVDDLKQANDGLATAGILPDGCVVVPMDPTEAMISEAFRVTRYNEGVGSGADLYKALIAAGEVK